jgi:hypothetical protein
VKERIVEVPALKKRPVYIESYLQEAIDQRSEIVAKYDLEELQLKIKEAESSGLEVVGVLFKAPDSISHIFGVPVLNYYTDNEYGIKP